MAYRAWPLPKMSTFCKGFIILTSSIRLLLKEKHSICNLSKKATSPLNFKKKFRQQKSKWILQNIHWRGRRTKFICRGSFLLWQLSSHFLFLGGRRHGTILTYRIDDTQNLCGNQIKRRIKHNKRTPTPLLP